MRTKPEPKTNVRKRPTKLKPPKDFSEAQEREAESEARRRATKAETAGRLAKTYTVTLTADERYWIENTIDRRLGLTPTEGRLLTKIRNASPDLTD